MEFDRLHTAAFSGHRTFKIGGGEDPALLRTRLRGAIGLLYEKGYDTFLSGMAEGFDLMAAREVLRIKEEGYAIRLAAIVPYPGQPENFSSDNATQYAAILAAADHIETICTEYNPRCFHLRNDFLIRNSSRLICYYNGSPGGTRYTFEKAMRNGLRPINLCLAENAAVTGSLF